MNCFRRGLHKGNVGLVGFVGFSVGFVVDFVCFLAVLIVFSVCVVGIGGGICFLYGF